MLHFLVDSKRSHLPQDKEIFYYHTSSAIQREDKENGDKLGKKIKMKLSASRAVTQNEVSHEIKCYIHKAS